MGRRKSLGLVLWEPPSEWGKGNPRPHHQEDASLGNSKQGIWEGAKLDQNVRLQVG